MARTARGTGADNRQKIIDAAAELMTEKGVEKTSLADIARKTGLSKGTLYYYYSSKNDLVFDITESHMSKISGEIFAMIDSDKNVTLEILLQRLFETILASDTRSRLHIFLLREAISGNAALHERFRHTYHEWFSMVEDAYQRLNLRTHGSILKSRILVSVLDGMIIQTLLDVEPPPPKDIVRQFIKIFEPQ